MGRVSVEVKSRAGEDVGRFCDAASYRKWRRELHKALGGTLAAAIDEDRILDKPAALETLPAGVYQAVLVQKTPIPREVRSQLRGCDLWKAV